MRRYNTYYARFDTAKEEHKVANSHTQKAIAELESGKSKRFEDVDRLMEDLNGSD